MKTFCKTLSIFPLLFLVIMCSKPVQNTPEPEPLPVDVTYRVEVRSDRLFKVCILYIDSGGAKDIYTTDSTWQKSLKLPPRYAASLAVIPQYNTDPDSNAACCWNINKFCPAFIRAQMVCGADTLYDAGCCMVGVERRPSHYKDGT